MNNFGYKYRNNLNPTINSNFRDIVDACLERNMELRYKHKEYFKGISNVHFKREFCTITLNLGRGTGHTTFMKDAFNPERDMVVVDTYRMIEQLRRDMGVNRNNRRVIHIEGVNSIYWQPYQYRAEFIFVDNASMTKTKDLDYLYQYMADDNFNQTFILLG